MNITLKDREQKSITIDGSRVLRLLRHLCSCVSVCKGTTIKTSQMQTYSNNEIAENHQLWSEYIDPLALDNEKAFDAMTIEEKLKIMDDCFGVH